MFVVRQSDAARRAVPRCIEDSDENSSCRIAA